MSEWKEWIVKGAKVGASIVFFPGLFYGIYLVWTLPGWSVEWEKVDGFFSGAVFVFLAFFLGAGALAIAVFGFVGVGGAAGGLVALVIYPISKLFRR